MDHLEHAIFCQSWNSVIAGRCLKKLTAKMAIGHEVVNDWQQLPAKALPEAKVFSVQH